MTATATAVPRPGPRSAGRTVGLAAAVTSGGVGLALAVVPHPGIVLLTLAAIALLAAMVLRLEWAVLAYVAVEPFGDLLGTVHPQAMKAVGGLLFVAWLLRLAVDDRAVVLRRPVLYAAGVLLLALLASAVVSGGNSGAGVEILARYLSYLGVLVVLVDTLRGPRELRRVAGAFVVSCTAAAVVGLVGFVSAGGGRASGPLADANDFGFYLLAAVPFAVLFARSGRRRGWWAVAAVVLVAGMLATFSRGALLGLVVAAVTGVLMGLVRLRPLLVGTAALAVAVLAAAVTAPALLERSLEEKAHVADQNVDSRFASWTIAAEMTADRPLLGHGPGGYRTSALDYAAPDLADTTHLDVAHNMYLDVASELGLVGAGAFVAMIGLAAAGLGRARRVPASAPLAAAAAAALAGCLVAACFLSEQYFLPVWLLVAIAVAVDPRRHQPGGGA